MPNTYTPLLRTIQQPNNGNLNLWGSIYDGGVIDLLEDALAGISSVDVTVGNVDLTPANGLTDDARPMFLYVVGNPGATNVVKVPTLNKFYFVVNATNPGEPVQIKTALSAAITIQPGQSPCLIYVDATNNLVRHVGRANAIAPMSAYTTLGITIVNRTAGTTGFNVKYAKQGHMVTLYVPPHTVTTSDASWGFSQALPATITPDNGADTHIFQPAFAAGLAAGAAACFFINPAAAGAKWGFTNVGTAAFGAGPFTFGGGTFVYSTRS